MHGVNRFLVSAATAGVVVLAFGCSSSPATMGPGLDMLSGTGGSAGSVTTDGGPSFPSAALSTFTTPDKTLQIELRTSPDQPIHVGPDHQALLRVTDTASGAPVDGISISVSTWMPVMRHKCSEVPLKVQALGNGEYLLTPLVASMAGKCEISLSLTAPLPDGGAGSKVNVTSPTFDVAQ